jgi:predicted nucleotidyltransferase
MIQGIIGMVETAIIENSVNRLLEYLNAEKLPVSKLVLFGSYAKGNFSDDSDIDFIVVSKTFRDMNFIERIDKTMYIDSKMIKEFLKPFDILYYSDIEWDNSSSIPINEAKKYGRILFNSN